MVLERNRRLNRVERKLLRTLRGLDRQYLRIGRRAPKWTRAIKNAVGTLGRRLRYQVYASQCKFDRNGEWMLDLAWSRDLGEILTRLPLAMESEWDPKDILWDFTKLVVVRADVRLMVFWGRTPERAERTVVDMLKQIRRLQGTTVGDRYLVCCWVEKPPILEWRSYVVK